jgi:uncharacterized protein (TIGR02391 family)
MNNDNSNTIIIDILHSRIIDNCLSLLNSNEYISAAREALVQVELAIKEKSGNPNGKFGINLVNEIFDGKNAITIKAPLDNNDDACKYFCGVFSYYRNYCAHDGRLINKNICIQILVIASNMLDIIHASSKSYVKVDGINGLIKNKVFYDAKHVIEYLHFLQDYLLIDDAIDGYFEQCAQYGYTNDQFQACVELGLIELENGEINDNILGVEELLTVEQIKLTKLGFEILNGNVS